VAARTKILRKYWFRIEEPKDPWSQHDHDILGEYHCLELVNGNWAFCRLDDPTYDRDQTMVEHPGHPRHPRRANPADWPHWAEDTLKAIEEGRLLPCWELERYRLVDKGTHWVTELLPPDHPKPKLSLVPESVDDLLKQPFYP
jgi:hypothetical protein